MLYAACVVVKFLWVGDIPYGLMHLSSLVAFQNEKIDHTKLVGGTDEI
jgi:hypothetical protein